MLSHTTFVAKADGDGVLYTKRRGHVLWNRRKLSGVHSLWNSFSPYPIFLRSLSGHHRPGLSLLRFGSNRFSMLYLPSLLLVLPKLPSSFLYLMDTDLMWISRVMSSFTFLLPAAAIHTISRGLYCASHAPVLFCLFLCFSS